MKSLTLESLSENRQALISIVDPPSGEGPSRVPPALESPFKDKPTLKGLSENGQLAEDPRKDPLVREVLKDLPAVGSPPKD